MFPKSISLVKVLEKSTFISFPSFKLLTSVFNNDFISNLSKSYCDVKIAIFPLLIFSLNSLNVPVSTLLESTLLIM